jgi:hypothetical protein
MAGLLVLLAVVMITLNLEWYCGSDKSFLLFLLYCNDKSSLLELSLKVSLLLVDSKAVLRLTCNILSKL